ncbi:MAG: hypothetical protein ACI4MI_01325 [Christensenellales bacterium]
MYNDDKIADEEAIKRMNKEYRESIGNDNMPVFLLQYVVKIKQNIHTLNAMAQTLKDNAKNEINVQLLQKIIKLLSKNSIRIDKNNIFSVATKYTPNNSDSLRKILGQMRKINVDTVDLIGEINEKANNENARLMMLNQLAVGYYLMNIV